MVRWSACLGILPLLFAVTSSFAQMPYRSQIIGADGAALILISGGNFWMGGNDNANERPRHRVYVDDFYMAKYETTNALYGRFMEATRREEPMFWTDSRFNAPDQPVVGVSWYDADAYCAWAKQRLPTEAEWLKAAQGLDGRKYPWGNRWDDSRANSQASGNESTTVVGSYPKGTSPYGIHDMAGNAMEWIADWYGDDYYRRAPVRNPLGPHGGALKGVRGGSWFDFQPLLRLGVRGGMPPEIRNALVGFRCARDAPK
jgi:formylglycine-generating enzyme required for sulfatase activity